MIVGTLASFLVSKTRYDFICFLHKDKCAEMSDGPWGYGPRPVLPRLSLIFARGFCLLKDTSEVQQFIPRKVLS